MTTSLLAHSSERLAALTQYAANNPECVADPYFREQFILYHTLTSILPSRHFDRMMQTMHAIQPKLGAPDTSAPVYQSYAVGNPNHHILPGRPLIPSMEYVIRKAFNEACHAYGALASPESSRLMDRSITRRKMLSAAAGGLLFGSTDIAVQKASDDGSVNTKLLQHTAIIGAIAGVGLQNMWDNNALEKRFNEMLGDDEAAKDAFTCIVNYIANLSTQQSSASRS